MGKVFGWIINCIEKTLLGFLMPFLSFYFSISFRVGWWSRLDLAQSSRLRLLVLDVKSTRQVNCLVDSTHHLAMPEKDRSLKL